jgi:hypothetical protein
MRGMCYSGNICVGSVPDEESLVIVTQTVRLIGKVNSVAERFIREANSVQKGTRGQHRKTSRVIGRFYFCVIFGVCNSVRLL